MGNRKILMQACLQPLKVLSIVDITERTEKFSVSLLAIRGNLLRFLD